MELIVLAIACPLMLLASVEVFPAPADVVIDGRRPFLLASRDRLQSLERFPDGAILELKGTLETLRIVTARGLPAEFNAWIGMSCAVDLEYEREIW